MANLSDEQLRHFEQYGYLQLGTVLDESQLDALRRRLDAIMLGEIRNPGLQFQLDTGGAYEALADPVAGLPEKTLGYRKVQGLETDPLFLELIQRPLFRDVCASQYGRHASVSIFRAMLMNKPAGQGTYLPWHQDAGDVWRLDRDPVVTVWIAIDRATRANGCLQFVPGSHRLGLLSKYGSTVSPEHAAIHCPDDAVRYLEVDAGEAVALHNWVLHRSGVNPTDAPRRALVFSYMDGRTLNALTGKRFPVVFGEAEPPETAMPFLKALRDENNQLRTTASEAGRYARSLLEHAERLEQARAEAERYAKSLEAELARDRRS